MGSIQIQINSTQNSPEETMPIGLRLIRHNDRLIVIYDEGNSFGVLGPIPAIPSMYLIPMFDAGLDISIYWQGSCEISRTANLKLIYEDEDYEETLALLEVLESTASITRLHELADYELYEALENNFGTGHSLPVH